MSSEHSGSGQDAPRQSYQLIRKLIPRKMQPLLRGLRKRWQTERFKREEPYRSVFPYTQMSYARQQNLVRLAKELEEKEIPGAVVECGVLDGGSAALMAWATSDSGRSVHLFDAWEGLPETTSEDGTAAKDWVGEVVGSPKRVARIMDKLGVAQDRVHFHVGWFDDTFPKADVSEVALANIDCDFFAPTKLCLDKWYPLLAQGGYMQFDDYSSFQGCRQAVNEFLSHHPETELQTYGTQGCAYFIQKPAS